MEEDFVSSDSIILDLLRKRGSMTVAQLADAVQVTATAVRQRLNRLLAHGYIGRASHKSGRGRPSHRYELTDKGRRKAGSNFADLATALWQEIWAVPDPVIRRGLVERLAKRLAVMYAGQIQGKTLEERMTALSSLFAERKVPLSVEQSDDLPVLTATACPYPDLADGDRSVCVMERVLFSELLGEDVHLAKCRLDGEACCTFESN
ncbi:MAG: AsnC family transcriptional regulator [Pirellulaceae bacterium]|nr:AsnC family transcriptional regulator [Pirellulaceae bacterium]